MSTTYSTIDAYYSDEYGAYAISDLKYEYGTTCTQGLRGLLMTNSRNTVIVQDELEFSSPTSFTWLSNLTGLYSISNDGKTAYARQRVNDQAVILRATLVTDDESLRFELTAGPELSNLRTPADGDSYAKASSPVKRLKVSAENKTSVKMAVVFEIMRHEDEVVGYRELVPMSEWETESDDWVKEANKDIVYPVIKPPAKYKGSSFLAAIKDYDNAQTLKEKGEIIRKSLIYLTDYEDDRSTLNAVEKYRAKIEEYNAEVRAVNEKLKKYFLSCLPSADPI